MSPREERPNQNQERTKNMKEAIQSNLDLINESLEVYSIANRVSNASFVIVAREGETACLTKQAEGYNFGGGASGAVTFRSKEAAEKVIEQINMSENVQPVVMGLGDAFRAKRDILVELKSSLIEALAKCEG